MSDTIISKTCPKCGGPIPAEAPQGLCPKCLLLQAAAPTEDGRGNRAQPVPPTQAELAAAFPHLEILELIGQGGMGFVFKARQSKLERLVALKILPQTLATDAAFAERFSREGRMLARLNHPNIVTIHDFGQAGGFFYLLMEYVDGVNLRQAMRTGRFTPAQALEVVPKICDALQFAHNEGILHRDIKPENILLDAKGRVKIADFGIAKLAGDRSADLVLTGQGAVLGTPHYMAPEQLEKPSTVDHRADIYSLGVVFYEMLNGELPIGKFQPPSQKVQVDVRLDDVVLHALEKEPSRRYQQASHVKTAVDTLAQPSAPPLAPPAAAPPRPDRFWKRLALGIVLGCAGMMLIAVLAILAAMLLPAYDQAKRSRARAQAAAAAMNQAQAHAGLSLEVAGIVVDDETGKPIAGARVSDSVWRFPDLNVHPKVAFTDAAGRFEMTVGVVAEHLLQVNASGYAANSFGLIPEDFLKQRVQQHEVRLRRLRAAETGNPEHPGGAALTNELGVARAELRKLRLKYTDAHPIVQALREKITELERSLPEQPASPNAGSTRVETSAAPSTNEFLARFERALLDRDTNAIAALYNWEGVSTNMKAFALKPLESLAKLPANAAQARVWANPLPSGDERETVRNGFRYTPNVTLLGIIQGSLNYLENGTNRSWGIAIPYGEKNGAFYLAGTRSEKLYDAQTPDKLLKVFVQTSPGGDAISFTGSVTYVQNGGTLTRDISGQTGVQKILFGDHVESCTVQKTSAGAGALQLLIWEDGQVVFTSPPASNAPIHFARDLPAASHSSPKFRSYPVGRTWGELGRVFDLSSPETAAASVLVRFADGSEDAATIMGKSFIDLPRLPAGSVKISLAPENVEKTLQSRVEEVVVCDSVLAGVISYQPTNSADRYICIVAGQRNGSWKLMTCDADANSRSTRAASVEQFKAEAPALLEKLRKLPDQPETLMTAAGREMADNMGEVMNAMINTAGQISRKFNSVSINGNPPPVGRPAANDPSAGFEFRWVARDDDTQSPADSLPWQTETAGQPELRVLREVLLDGHAVASAEYTTDGAGRKEIRVLLTDEGARAFATLTGANISRQLAIVWRGRVVSAPVIRSAITGREVQISGNFAPAESQLLLDVLNHRSTNSQTPEAAR